MLISPSIKPDNVIIVPTIFLISGLRDLICFQVPHSRYFDLIGIYFKAFMSAITTTTTVLTKCQNIMSTKISSY